MTTLSFTRQTNGSYKANATVNAPFNLHIERKEQGNIIIEASTVSSANKAKVMQKHAPEVWEQDFVDHIYPKYLTITSSVPVDKAYITEES